VKWPNQPPANPAKTMEGLKLATIFFPLSLNNVRICAKNPAQWTKRRRPSFQTTCQQHFVKAVLLHPALVQAITLVGLGNTTVTITHAILLIAFVRGEHKML